MSLAKLIDPSRLFAESFGLTKMEHFEQLLGVGTNFVSCQAEIFKHAQENSIELSTYVKQLIMLLKELMSRGNGFTSPPRTLSNHKEVTRTYTGLIWAALSFCYLSFVYQLSLLVMVLDTFSEQTLLLIIIIPGRLLLF